MCPEKINKVQRLPRLPCVPPRDRHSAPAGGLAGDESFCRQAVSAVGPGEIWRSSRVA